MFNRSTPSSVQPDWVPALSEFLRANQQVEAVLLDPHTRTLSVATVGSIDREQLQRSLESTLERIEEWARSQPHRHGTRVKQLGHQTLIEKPSCPTAPALWTWRTLEWPHTKPSTQVFPEWQKMAILTGITALLGLAGLVAEYRWGIHSPFTIGCYILAMLVGGWDALKDVVQELPKGHFDIHFLMLAVAIGASSIGAFGEGALLLFLFSLSGTLEHFALHRTRRELDSLFKKAPKVAWVRDETGAEKAVPVEAIAVGALISVRPGDLFPLDAEVVWGQSAADEANLTGESIPIPKSLGDPVYSGTLNLWGSLRARVLRPVQQSALQKIIQLIQEAQHRKAPSERLTERFGTHYTLGILGLTVALFIFWGWGLGLPWFTQTPGSHSAFYRAMTFLVVTSPCALVLSIPSAILAAIAWGAKNGILFQGGAAIEKLAQVDVVALDKTGTLTTGELVVQKVESFPEGREQAVAQMAYALERHANHPIARAIVRYGQAQGLEGPEAEGFVALTGMGVRGHLEGEACVLGRRELLAIGPLGEWVKTLPEPPAEYAEVWVMHKDLLGRILLKDVIRSASAPVLAQMHTYGLRTLMLTGDHRSRAQAVGHELGIAEVRAGLTPQQKVEAIEALRQEGLHVAMVGDGVNDAPSLAASDVAIAMGARGADAALEHSDVVLMHDRIEAFWDAFLLSQRANQIIRQNLVLSLGTIALMAAGVLYKGVPISLGVLAHEGSTVLVCLNSLRLLMQQGGFWLRDKKA